jgi:DNA-binding NtrC family response regulator
MVAEGTFRSDLFYRLNVVTIEVPPLRDRRDDIPLLIDHYVRTIARQLGKPVPELSADLLALLCNHDWPGNVRELRNSLESMLVLSRGDRLTLDDLPAGFAASETLEAARTAGDEESRLDSLEKSVILQTLKRFDGNRTRTAMELGISVRTLQRRLKSWGMAAVES